MDPTISGNSSFDASVYCEIKQLPHECVWIQRIYVLERECNALAGQTERESETML